MTACPTCDAPVAVHKTDIPTGLMRPVSWQCQGGCGGHGTFKEDTPCVS